MIWVEVVVEAVMGVVARLWCLEVLVVEVARLLRLVVVVTCTHP